jgi:thioredoxin-like negative regulator of GroEL
MGDGWKDGDKVVRLEKDDLPEKLVEMTHKGPVFVKMYEEWCHHCTSMKPHFKVGCRARCSSYDTARPAYATR